MLILSLSGEIPITVKQRADCKIAAQISTHSSVTQISGDLSDWFLPRNIWLKSRLILTWEWVLLLLLIINYWLVFLQSAAKPLQADIKLLNKIQSLIPQNVCEMTAFVSPYKITCPCLVQTCTPPFWNSDVPNGRLKLFAGTAEQLWIYSIHTYETWTFSKATGHLPFLTYIKGFPQNFWEYNMIWYNMIEGV